MLVCNTARLLAFAVAVSIQCTPLHGAERREQKGESVTLERYGVTFRAPANWFVPAPGKIAENIRQLDSSKEDIRAILASHRGSIEIATYLRQNPRRHSGLIPTINVLSRPNPHKTFESFQQMIAASARSIGSTLRNYVIKTAPEERMLSGRRVAFFAAEYDISTADGISERVLGMTYAIPFGEMFIQVSTSETLPEKEKDVFAGFINSFAFTEP